ncbi:YegP family protein [Nocardioides sp.]|uniref:YegP family protein n=1 Tax=Nocardioides sp. TaxID=35761 RepID=UPI0037846F24
MDAMWGRFEVVEVGGEYRWQLRDAQGELVARSQGYIWKSAAIEAIEMVRSVAAGAEVVDLATD